MTSSGPFNPSLFWGFLWISLCEKACADKWAIRLVRLAGFMQNRGPFSSGCECGAAAARRAGTSGREGRTTKRGQSTARRVNASGREGRHTERSGRYSVGEVSCLEGPAFGNVRSSDLHLLGHDHVSDLLPCFANVGSLPQHALEHDNAERVVVGRDSVILSAHHLRSHVPAGE